MLAVLYVIATELAWRGSERSTEVSVQMSLVEEAALGGGVGYGVSGGEKLLGTLQA